LGFHSNINFRTNRASNEKTGKRLQQRDFAIDYLKPETKLRKSNMQTCKVDWHRHRASLTQLAPQFVLVLDLKETPNYKKRRFFCSFLFLSV